MSRRELRRLEAELRDAAMVYTVDGAGLSSLQAGRESALAETERAVQDALSRARAAGLDGEASRLLMGARAHPDFRGSDDSDWQAFLDRVGPSAPSSRPATTGAAVGVTSSGRTVPTASLGGSHQRQASQSSGSGLASLVAMVVAVLALWLGGRWVVNQFLTRTSAEVGRCYDTADVVVGTFDETECGQFEGMLLFAVGDVEALRASPSCPNHSLTLIVDRPDQAYCFAPVHLGPVPSPASSSPGTAPATSPSTTAATSTTTPADPILDNLTDRFVELWAAGDWSAMDTLADPAAVAVAREWYQPGGEGSGCSDARAATGSCELLYAPVQGEFALIFQVEISPNGRIASLQFAGDAG